MITKLIEEAIPKLTVVKNTMVQLLVIEGGLPIGNAMKSCEELFELIDEVVADIKGEEIDTKTGSLFNENN